MNRARIIFFILLILLIIGYNNCSGVYRLDKLLSLNGTEIGNPGPTNPGPVFETTATTQIRSYTCALLVRCKSDLTIADCEDHFQDVTGVGEALGLPAGRYEPFSSLQEAEREGRITYDAVPLENCIQEITSLPCSDSRVDQAYTSGELNPIGGTANVYPSTSDSCPNVFSETSAGLNQ